MGHTTPHISDGRIRPTESGGVTLASFLGQGIHVGPYHIIRLHGWPSHRDRAESHSCGGCFVTIALLEKDDGDTRLPSLSIP